MGFLQVSLAYINQLTVLSGLAAALVIAVRCARSGQALELKTVVAALFAGSTVPTGFALFACAIDPSLIQLLAGLNVHISVAGIVLLFTGYESLRQIW